MCRHRTPMLVAIAILSACESAYPESYAAPEIVSATSDEVAIRAGHLRNPGPLAAQHCARYGKEAALRPSTVVQHGGTVIVPPRIPIFHFNCVAKVR